MPATWVGGTLTSPGSTGTQAITGLGAQPQALVFYGANWTTEDANVSSTGTGVFRGMAGPQYDAPSTIVQNAAFVAPSGDAHWSENVAIAMLNTSSGFLMAAAVDSFDSDGFTLDWTLAASGYKIVWLALFDTDEIGAFQGSDSTVATLGWKAGASLLHGAWHGPSVVDTDRTQEWYGGGAYPGTLPGGWFGAGLAAQTFPTSASAQYNIGIQNLAPGTSVVSDQTFVGPFLDPQNVTARPTGTGLVDFTFDTNLADNHGICLVWDDEDSETGRQATPPASTGNTTFVSLPFDPGLVIGYSISNEPDGQGNGGRGAIGFSVATRELQWCALSDSFSTPRSAFLSFQRGFVDAGDAGNFHAGTVTLEQGGFTLETFEDDTTAQDWVWHAFGHPRRDVFWIPHIYRQVVTA